MTLEPLSDLRVVDLYAGSGALGIEALSRGASHVDFVESSAPARRVLESNLSALGLKGRARIWPLELPQGLRRLKGVIAAADLVLLDPPYGGGAAGATLMALSEGTAFKPGIRVVVEHHAKDSIPDAAGRLERAGQRRYGETVMSTYRAKQGAGPLHAEEE